MGSTNNGVADVPLRFDDDARRAKLAAAREAKAAREAALQVEREEAEIARAELVERLEHETGGREGDAFAIVDATDVRAGFVVVKLGDFVLFKAFSNSKMTEVDVDAFVLPCVVHPSKDEYRKLAMQRAAIPLRCANALASLYGVKEGREQGK